MTPEERWQRIEEKHLALAQSVELLTHDIHAMQQTQQRADERERKLRNALLAGIAGFLRGLDEGETNGDT